MIRVLMVDDEPLVRRGIVAGVDWAALGCEVVGEAQSGEEGLALARKLKPELIITALTEFKPTSHNDSLIEIAYRKQHLKVLFTD